MKQASCSEQAALWVQERKQRLLFSATCTRDVPPPAVLALWVQERNERLFFYVICSHIEELVPLLSEPTLSEYCLKYSLMFRR